MRYEEWGQGFSGCLDSGVVVSLLIFVRCNVLELSVLLLAVGRSFLCGSL